MILAGFAAAAGAAPAPEVHRIVAVGDLHGDFNAWQDVARDAGLIDARGHWAGGTTTLVQLGDITDRGPDSLKIIRNLQQLQQEARAKGGKVIVLLGNHEAMNVVGDYRYTTAGEYAAFATEQSPALRERVFELNRAKLQAAQPSTSPQQLHDSWIASHPLGWVEHRNAWLPAGELGQWAAHNPAVVRIDGTLFVHGGLSAEYSKLSLDQINRRAALAVQAGVGGANSILDDPLGPLWYRGLVIRDSDAQAVRGSVTHTPAEELGVVLAAYGAQRMVVAHTPSLKGIEITLGGRLARIDTGMSAYYGGPLSWLEISGSTMIPHTVRRSTP